MATLTPFVEHLLRRAGFGATPAERDRFAQYTYPVAVAALTDFDPSETDVDDKIGQPGYVSSTIRSPNTVIDEARQRWLFRMVHSPAPLQERMALLWHHHFATAYLKLAGLVGTVDATRMMAAKPSSDPGGAKGQYELFREHALGNFRTLLTEVAKDPAMLYWLDGYLNFRAVPQENFGRELMELFTFGIGNYTEQDVYAAARVFTGWNVTNLRGGQPNAARAFNYNAAQHDINAKTFTFAIYPDGGRTVPARSAAAGMQDGIDLINALAIHPETARRLARRLWTWFVSETDAPDGQFVDNISNVYLKNDTNMKPVIRAVLFSPQFLDSARFYQRYSWPVEYLVRSLKEVGHVGFGLNNALTPLVNMGQQLFEPPDVNGWDIGPGWFSTGGMLARMNFAATLTTNQRVALRTAASTNGARETPEKLLAFCCEGLSIPEPTGDARAALIDYVNAGGAYVGTDAQLNNKAPGLVHLLTGSGAYQIV